jgi:murein DD-endopeptidase MepM/ murein hydrolase activator NlpD
VYKRQAYSHLSGIFVEEGQWVSRGEVIGQMGSTGNSTGPHIHFQVYGGGTRQNPYAYLPPSPAQ